jgi:hypothetical protein
MDEILDMTCETVREMARYAANPSSDAPKDPGDLDRTRVCTTDNAHRSHSNERHNGDRRYETRSRQFRRNTATEPEQPHRLGLTLRMARALGKPGGADSLLLVTPRN